MFLYHIMLAFGRSAPMAGLHWARNHAIKISLLRYRYSLPCLRRFGNPLDASPFRAQAPPRRGRMSTAGSGPVTGQMSWLPLGGDLHGDKRSSLVRDSGA